MTGLIFQEKSFEKKKEVLTKVNSFREKFKKRETEVQADLEKTGRILKNWAKDLNGGSRCHRHQKR